MGSHKSVMGYEEKLVDMTLKHWNFLEKLFFVS